MLGTRFEEYISFDEGLPFMFTSDITRSLTFYSREANWHENLELQLCTKGSGKVLLDEKSVNVSENDIVVVNSNRIHHTNTTDTITYDCLIFDTDFCRRLDIDVMSSEFESLFCDDSIKEQISVIKDLLYRSSDVCRKAKLYKAAVEILIALRERHTLCERKEYVPNTSFEAVKNSIKYIRENYMHKIYLDDISSAVYMDKYKLSRVFKKITGQTPVQYINGYRCRKTAEYISDGKTVSEAALACGFTNMSFFTRTFKLHIGKLPSKVKK